MQTSVLPGFSLYFQDLDDSFFSESFLFEEKEFIDHYTNAYNRNFFFQFWRPKLSFNYMKFRIRRFLVLYFNFLKISDYSSEYFKKNVFLEDTNKVNDFIKTLVLNDGEEVFIRYYLSMFHENQKNKKE